MKAIRDFIYDEYGFTQEERDFRSDTRIPERIAWVRHIITHFVVKYYAPLKIDVQFLTRQQKTILGKLKNVPERNPDSYSCFIQEVAHLTNRKIRQSVYNSLKRVDEAWWCDKEFRKELTRLNKLLIKNGVV